MGGGQVLHRRCYAHELEQEPRDYKWRGWTEIDGKHSWSKAEEL